MARVASVVAVTVAALAVAAALRVERFGEAGAPSLTFEVVVPPEVARDGIEATWRARLPEHRLEVRPGADGAVVEVIGAELADEVVVAAALTRSAHLELRMVVHGTTTARRWYQRTREPDPALGPVRGDTDTWFAYDTDQRFEDWYLRAATPDAITAAIAHLDADDPRDPNERALEVVLEHVTPHASADDRAPYVRTYLVRPEVELDARDVARAQVIPSPHDGRPEVLVELTNRGRARFAALTERAVGHKLAILVDGEVTAAPIIQSAITGGQVTITMGRSADPEAALAQATALARTLAQRAPLPRGLEARRIGHRARDATIVWAVRGGVAALIGALAWLAAGIAARRRWFLRTPEAVTPRLRTEVLDLPLLFTFILPLVVWIAGRVVWLPFVNQTELDNILAAGDAQASARFGVLGLGLMPIGTAFIAVELVALLVPAWRQRRLGTPADRAGLDRAVVVTAILLALVQGWFIAQWLASVSGRGVEVLIENGTGARALIALTLAAGVMVHVVAASAISRHGLCNGWLALLAAYAVGDLGDLLLTPPRGDDPRAALIAVALAAAVAAVIATGVRTRDDGRRLPWAGLVPAMLVPALLAVHNLVAVSWPELALHVERLRPPSPWFELIVAIPFTGIAAWASRRTFSTAGAAVTTGFVVLLVLLPMVLPRGLRPAEPALSAMLVALAVVEIAIGVRARAGLRAPVAVLVVHDVERADRAADALRAAGIAHALTGVRARALLRFFGPFAPITLVVGAADADPAAQVIGDACAGSPDDGKAR